MHLAVGIVAALAALAVAAAAAAAPAPAVKQASLKPVSRSYGTASVSCLDQAAANALVGRCKAQASKMHLYARSLSCFKNELKAMMGPDPEDGKVFCVPEMTIIHTFMDCTKRMREFPADGGVAGTVRMVLRDVSLAESSVHKARRLVETARAAGAGRIQAHVDAINVLAGRARNILIGSLPYPAARFFLPSVSRQGLTDKIPRCGSNFPCCVFSGESPERFENCLNEYCRTWERCA